MYYIHRYIYLSKVRSEVNYVSKDKVVIWFWRLKKKIRCTQDSLLRISRYYFLLVTRCLYLYCTIVSFARNFHARFRRYVRINQCTTVGEEEIWKVATETKEEDNDGAAGIRTVSAYRYTWSVPRVKRNEVSPLPFSLSLSQTQGEELRVGVYPFYPGNTSGSQAARATPSAIS